MQDRIFVTRPSMPPYEEYMEAIKPLWDSRWITNMGKYHMELEESLKSYLEVPELSLMANGHMALEMAVQAMGFPEGGEVITTPLTFISTTHAIVRNRLKPVFCDVKPHDGTMDERKIEGLVTERTAAILPVHVYGNVCNVEEIQRIADRHGLKVIYDAAHAFGVKYRGRGVGAYGDASVFSFHATKVFNTIEGGAVTFRDRSLYEKLYDLKNFGIRGEELVAEVGANAKMNEFAAVMGLCNLRHIDEAMESRKACIDAYRDRLGDVKGIGILEGNPDATRNCGYFPVIVQDGYGMGRDELCEHLKRNGIHPRKYFHPLTADQACYRGAFRDAALPNARELARRVLALPVYEGMTWELVERVCGLL